MGNTKKIAMAVSLIPLALALYWGYLKHSETQLLEILTPHVKNASIRVANSSRLVLEPSQVTFKEIFDRADADVAELEKRTIEVQSISNAKTASISTPVVTYLQSSQEFSRSLAMKYRKTLALSSASDRVNDALADQRSGSSYGYEQAYNRTKRAIDEMSKAGDEVIASTKDFAAAGIRLKDARSKLVSFFPEDALVPTKQLDDIIASNSEKPKTAPQVKK